ncbi:MAG: undecaprenyldiphospho-muramoylpentapeptide beta-N-acetylglucosaminyltransferase [Flavobacteriales bacterium]|nr:undecaprenyldiphospho-muramoylpentapeptide beta-N-acetylglucosaminyltransferase [Flavobacteriales bacterium]MBL6873047.1 undecaprenyldiphospho-muramoylpentapeptide beta-N-acetylglucosaminyltransferase [Flavobacteriales bacterium]
MSVKVIISGGGTGGHIFPAISIANELKSRIKDIDILFVGAKGRMEMEKVPKAGYPIKGLSINGFQRNWRDTRNLSFPFKLLFSLLKSYFIVRKFKPEVVVGTGGYASGPLLFVASKLSIPALIQEQNSYPGITNKLLSKSVQKICVAYENMQRFFPEDKLLLLGNPIRKDLIGCASKKAQGIKHFELDEIKPVVLVIGGSLGARTINESMAALIDDLESGDIQLIWQTGVSFEKQALELTKDKKNIQASAFIYEMDLAYSVADVIISRAGASTISELCLIGKPAILVPSPNVAEDHQTKNAMALVDKSAALMVKDNEAKKELGKTLSELLNNNEKQKKLAKNIKKLAIADSSKLIVDEVLKLID